MCEMVQTERDYVNSLQYIIENYIPELQREDVPQALRGKRNVIFGNLEKIYQFHCQYFLREVEMCEQKPFQIAHYFLMHVSYSCILFTHQLRYEFHYIYYSTIFFNSVKY